jgi:hypothetical protein
LTLGVVAVFGTGVVVSTDVLVPFVSACVVSEVLSSVERFRFISAVVATDGTTVSLGIRECSLTATVDTGIVFSSKVVTLNSGRLVTDVVSETLEKSANCGDVDLNRAVVYLAAVASVLAVALLSVDASGGAILIPVDEISVLVVLS